MRQPCDWTSPLKNRCTLLERSDEPPAFNARRISFATDAGVVFRLAIYLTEPTVAGRMALS